MLPNEPQPTGLVDAPVLIPVQSPRGDRGHGWPFAVSMVLVAVLGGGALFMSGYSVGRDQGRAPGGSVSEGDAWKPFWNVYDAVTTRYPLGSIERSTLIEGAIRGLVESVGDPYSTYLSPEDFQGTLNDISGTFEGIGAEIGSVDNDGNGSDCATFGPNCHLVILKPLDDSPALKAGLKPGDVVLKVDGATLDGLTPTEAREKVRGKAGTEVTLHIQRFAAAPAPTGSAGSPAPNATKPPRQLLEEFDVKLVRAKVQRREVTSRVLANGTVGYVSLSGFSGEGAKQLKAAMQVQLDSGIKKIVFDLRGNPADSCPMRSPSRASSSPTGPIYWTQDANGKQTETEAQADGIATDPKVQVVVLIDRGSASASEIVAGALQDRGRAKLIGETSFGKGTVQEWIDLGSLGGVKLTVNKWLTPNKRWIHKVGLTPDVAVTVPADNPPGSDPVLDKALEVLGAAALAPRTLLLAA